METKKPFHETVAEKLIEKLKEGTAPWQKPWQAGDPGAVMPINPTTGKRYRGINAIHLMSQGHTDQRWMTYKQAAAVDAQVRKGEKGTPIQYWKFSDEQHLEATQGINPGRSKAEEAAKAVGGKILLPIFAPGEQAANPKGFTDFNDLANKSELGQEGIDRQVRSIVESVIEKHRARNADEQKQERVQQQERPRRAAKIE